MALRRRRHPIEAGDAGFTLLELMVAATVMGILLVYVFGTMASTHRRSEVSEQLMEAQQTVRTVAEMIERDLRHAGFMVPEAAAVCGVDSTVGPDRIFISNSDALMPGSILEPDLGAAIVGNPVNIVAGAQTLTVDSLVLETDTPDPAYDSDGDNTLDSDFQVGDGVIIADENNPDRGSACGVVQRITLPDILDIDIVTDTLAAPGGGDTPSLKVVPANVYTIDANRQLFRGRYLLADEIEDMQIAWLFDDDGDNVVDPNEYRSDGAGPAYDAAALDVTTLREVRLNLVVRTRTQDPSNSQGRMQALENRAPAAANDSFRRRVYTSTVRLRNIGQRAEL